MTLENRIARMEKKLDLLIQLVAKRIVNEPELLDHLAQELAQSNEALQSSVDAAKQGSPEGV